MPAKNEQIAQQVSFIAPFPALKLHNLTSFHPPALKLHPPTAKHYLTDKHYPASNHYPVANHPPTAKLPSIIISQFLWLDKEEFFQLVHYNGAVKRMAFALICEDQIRIRKDIIVYIDAEFRQKNHTVVRKIEPANVLPVKGLAGDRVANGEVGIKSVPADHKLTFIAERNVEHREEHHDDRLRL